MEKLITKEVVADLFVTLCATQSEKYGGDTTINELRVIASCYQAFVYERDISVSSISSSLGMPSSTVHRAVTNMIAKGWIVDKPHPTDGRKRLIAMSEKSILHGFWEQVSALIYGHPSNTRDKNS